MHVTVYFKGAKDNKQHFNVDETYVCPLNNEFSVYLDSDRTIRYTLDEISDIVTKD